MNGVSFNSKSLLGDKLAIQQLDESKQDKLTFDTTPTEGSSNPVTSDGVASAMSEIAAPEFKLTDKIWTPTHWKVEHDGEVYSFDESTSAYAIWTDGDNIYYDASHMGSFVLNKSTSTWFEKEWNGYTPDFGSNVWTDGENYYGVSEPATDVHVNVVLNKSTSTWETQTWYGLPNNTIIYGSMVWTDGDNIYFSDNTASNINYVLDKSTSTWSEKEWNGYPPAFGRAVWTDGENYYAVAVNTENEETIHTVLDKTTSTWSRKTWYGLSEMTIDPDLPDVVNGLNVWTDGEDIYYLSVYSQNQYVLDKATSTWNIIGNYGFADIGSYSDYSSVIWTDGDNIYYSNIDSSEPTNYVFGPKYLEIKTSSITANVPLVDIGPNITISSTVPQEGTGNDGDIWLVYKN